MNPLEVHVIAPSRTAAELHAGRMTRTAHARGLTPVGKPVTEPVGESWRVRVEFEAVPAPATVWRESQDV